MAIRVTAKVSLRDFLHVVFKRKIQIFLFFTCTICAVVIGTLMTKPTYKAVSQLLVKIGRENIYVPTGNDPRPVFSFNSEEQLISEMEILKSRSLARKVVESLGPTVIYKNLNDKDKGIMARFLKKVQAQQSPVKKAVLEFQKTLKIENVTKSNVIEVGFQHRDPHMAATVVNSLVNFYLDHHLQVHKNPKSFKFFQEQSDILKGKSQQSENRLKAFKKQHDITSLGEQLSLLLRQEADLRAALNQTLSLKAETENRTRQLQIQLASTPKSIPQGEQIEHSPYVINTLQARLVELELKEKELLTKYTDQSRLVRNVRQEIILVRQKVAEQEAKRYQTSSLGLNPTYQRLQEELFRNQADLTALEAKKEIQHIQLYDYKKRLEDLNRIEVELNQLQHEVDGDRKNFELYLTKFEESRISEAMDTEGLTNVSVIEPALPPLKPVSPKVLLNILLGVLLGVFGSLALVFFLEYLDDSLEKTEEVEEYLQLPVLATIPELKQ
ncbi:MAG: GumC family protein [Desulfobacteraceae bacterium]|nr:MAG: GumC family protein [Desulfobacteraceae bacterium]